MNLANANLMYEKDKIYKAHIDTVWDMGYLMYWDNNIDPNVLMDTIEKVTCKYVAEEIMSAIIADQKVFE